MAGNGTSRARRWLAVACGTLIVAGLVGAAVHDSDDAQTVAVTGGDTDDTTTSTAPSITTTRRSTTTTAEPTTTTAEPTTTTAAPPPPPPTNAAPPPPPPTTAPPPPPPPPPAGSEVLLVNDYGSPIDVTINTQSWRVETAQRLPVFVPAEPIGDSVTVYRADDHGCGDGDGGHDVIQAGHRYELRFYPGYGQCPGGPTPHFDFPPREV